MGGNNKDGRKHERTGRRRWDGCTLYWVATQHISSGDGSFNEGPWLRAATREKVSQEWGGSHQQGELTENKRTVLGMEARKRNSRAGQGG